MTVYIVNWAIGTDNGLKAFSSREDAETYIETVNAAALLLNTSFTTAPWIKEETI